MSIGSRTGRRNFFKKLKGLQGLSFFEVMVTCVILSLGITMIYASFLSTLDHQDHVSLRLYAMNFLASKAETLLLTHSFSQKQPAEVSQESYDAVVNNKPVHFQLDMKALMIEQLGNVFQMDLNLSWEEKGRKKKITKTIFIP